MAPENLRCDQCNSETEFHIVLNSVNLNSPTWLQKVSWRERVGNLCSRRIMEW